MRTALVSGHGWTDENPAGSTRVAEGWFDIREAAEGIGDRIQALHAIADDSTYPSRDQLRGDLRRLDRDANVVCLGILIGSSASGVEHFSASNHRQIEMVLRTACFDSGALPTQLLSAAQALVDDVSALISAID